MKTPSPLDHDLLISSYLQARRGSTCVDSVSRPLVSSLVILTRPLVSSRGLLHAGPKKSGLERRARCPRSALGNVSTNIHVEDRLFTVVFSDARTTFAVSIHRQPAHSHDTAERRHDKARRRDNRLLGAQLARCCLLARATCPRLDCLRYGAEGGYSLSTSECWLSHFGARRLL